MRTREKKRIVRLFLEGNGIKRIAETIWGLAISVDYPSATCGTVEVVLRDALRERMRGR